MQTGGLGLGLHIGTAERARSRAPGGRCRAAEAPSPSLQRRLEPRRVKGDGAHGHSGLKGGRKARPSVLFTPWGPSLRWDDELERREPESKWGPASPPAPTVQVRKTGR